MIELSTGEIIAGISVLCGFIGALLKVIHGHFSETKKRMIEMEDHHRTQNEHVIELTGKVGRLEGERDGFIMGVEKISADVIAEVKGLKEE